MLREGHSPWTHRYAQWGAIPVVAVTLYTALAHVEVTLMSIALLLILVTAIGLMVGMALGEYVHRQDD